MNDLLTVLKHAHLQAQSIPDLEIELREVLFSMGYTLGKRSPFIEPEAQSLPDMNDWRNWQFGDIVIDSQLGDEKKRRVIRIEDRDYTGVQPVEVTAGDASINYWPYINALQWHSRAAYLNKGKV